MDRLEIYNSIANAINDYDSSVYVTQRYEPIPESIPCVFVQQIGKARTLQYATLTNTDEQYRRTFEVQVFHTTLNEAYALMETIEDAFKQLAFFEDLCEPIDNADQKIARIAARFYAQLGGQQEETTVEPTDNNTQEENTDEVS